MINIYVWPGPSNAWFEYLSLLFETSWKLIMIKNRMHCVWLLTNPIPPICKNIWLIHRFYSAGPKIRGVFENLYNLNVFYNSNDFLIQLVVRVDNPNTYVGLTFMGLTFILFMFGKVNALPIGGLIYFVELILLVGMYLLVKISDFFANFLSFTIIYPKFLQFRFKSLLKFKATSEPIFQRGHD